MKTKFKSMYVIENDVNLWWSSHYRKWIKLEDRGKYGCSSSRMFKNKKKAMAHFESVGYGFVMIQTIFLKGTYKETIFEWR